jgi:hypothetical protein
MRSEQINMLYLFAGVGPASNDTTKLAGGIGKIANNTWKTAFGLG